MNIRKNRRGFTLVEIMIVVAIIGLLAAIAVPNFVQARNTTRINACLNNLRLIDAAKDQWAMENQIAGGADAVEDDVNDYLKGGVTPTCPEAGTYDFTTVDGLATCTVATHVAS